MIYYLIFNSSPTVPVLGQTNPILTLPPYYPKLNFIIILPTFHASLPLAEIMLVEIRDFQLFPDLGLLIIESRATGVGEKCTEMSKNDTDLLFRIGSYVPQFSLTISVIRDISFLALTAIFMLVAVRTSNLAVSVFYLIL